MSLDNLKSVAGDLADVRAKIKALQVDEQKYVTLLKRVISAPIETMLDDVLLTMRYNKGRTSYDWQAMMDDGWDLTPYMKVGAPVSVLSVKRIDPVEKPNEVIE